MVKSFKCTRITELKRFKKPESRARRFDILANADQKFRIPAEVRNRMNMMTGTTYLIMIL